MPRISLNNNDIFDRGYNFTENLALNNIYQENIFGDLSIHYNPQKFQEIHSQYAMKYGDKSFDIELTPAFTTHNCLCFTCFQIGNRDHQCLNQFDILDTSFLENDFVENHKLDIFYTQYLIGVNFVGFLRKHIFDHYFVPVHLICPVRRGSWLSNKIYIDEENGYGNILFIEHNKLTSLYENIFSNSRTLIENQNNFWYWMEYYWNNRTQQNTILYQESNPRNNNDIENYDIPNSSLAQEYKNRKENHNLGFTSSEIGKMIIKSNNIPEAYLKKIYLEILNFENKNEEQEEED